MIKRVIKVGGSLLQIPDLVERIEHWLRSVEPRQNIFIAGGGEFCNELRRLHNRFQFSESFSHELCLQQMTVTAQILSRLLEAPAIESVEDARESSEDIVFVCQKWILEQSAIPQSWDVTSDSISALVATEFNGELVLFKSVDSREAVDQYFSIASKDIPQVEFVNLAN